MWYCVRYEISGGKKGMAIFPTKEIWQEEIKKCIDDKNNEFFELDHMDFLPSPE